MIFHKKENLDKFTATENEVEQIELHETHSRIFRSKAQWIEEGEKVFLKFRKKELQKQTNHITRSQRQNS